MSLILFKNTQRFLLAVEGFFGFSLTNLKIVAETAGGVQ
jgi:hypothetical protein